MKMENLTTGVAYGTAAVNSGYWALQWMDKISPNQWAAIGVLGSLLFGLLTWLTNVYFKRKEFKRREREWEERASEAE